MQRIPQPIYAHAKSSCYLCGSAANGIDFEVFIEGEGVLFLCRGCVTEAATTLGLKLADPTIEERLKEAEVELEEARAARNLAEAMVFELNKRAHEITENRLERARKARAKNVAERHAEKEAANA